MGPLKGGVSVVIATYNRPGPLGEAVRSALGQTLAPLEVLVCDDGSSETVREAVEALEPRVRWIACGRHGRPALPRNRGIAEARGEWVAILDDDDRWLPCKLERQAEFAAEGFGAVGTDARRLDGQGRDLGPLLGAPPRRVDLGALMRRNEIVASSALVRRSLLLDCGGFPEGEGLRALEDYALWLRIASRTPWGVVPEALVEYRDAPGASLRGQGAAPAWAQRRRVMGDLFRWSLGPGRSPATAARAARAWLGAALRQALGRPA